MTTTTAKASYLEGTGIQLELWGKQLRSLRRSLADRARFAGSTARKQLEKLEARRRNLERRLQEAAHVAHGERWEDVREDLESAVDHFRELAIEVHNKARKA